MQGTIHSNNASETSSILEPIQRFEPITFWPKLDTSRLQDLDKIIPPQDARHRLNSMTSD